METGVRSTRIPHNSSWKVKPLTRSDAYCKHKHFSFVMSTFTAKIPFMNNVPQTTNLYHFNDIFH